MRPDHAATNEATPAVVEGNRFYHAVEIDLDQRDAPHVLDEWVVHVDDRALPASDVEWRSPESIAVVLPTGLRTGTHSLTVTSPTGLGHRLERAFEVGPPSGASDSDPIADAGIDIPEWDVGDAGPDAGAAPSPCDPFAFGAPERLEVPNFPGSLFGPAPSSDALTLFFASYYPLGTEKVWVMTRTDRGLAFTEPRLVDSVNSTFHDGTPSLSADGRSLYFYSTRSGPSNRDLWRATRSSPVGPFDPPERLGAVNGNAREFLPRIGEDELTLWFTSDRGVDNDIWLARRASKDEDFDVPVERTDINTNSNESGASLSSDGLAVYFSSDRGGNDDLWVALRPDVSSPFEPGVPLSALNSTAEEFDPVVTRDDEEIFFSSFRGGSWAVWRSVRQCP